MCCNVFHGLLKCLVCFNRNPLGRTGIAGRGLFGRWGPNHYAHLIATRLEQKSLGDCNTTTFKRGSIIWDFTSLVGEIRPSLFYNCYKITVLK